MTLTLTPDVETRLRTLAAQRGQAPEGLIEDYVRREMPVEELPTFDLSSAPDPTLALLAQWAVEDATDDPVEIAQRQKDSNELMAALSANRFSLEGRTDFKELFGDDTQENSQDNTTE